jgi:hypothetical protein
VVGLGGGRGLGCVGWVGEEEVGFGERGLGEKGVGWGRGGWDGRGMGERVWLGRRVGLQILFFNK